jgi:rare lipoprotein A
VTVRRSGRQAISALLALAGALLAGALLALPAVALAQDPLAIAHAGSGGGGLGSIGATGGTTVVTTATASPSPAVSASGDGVTLTTTSTAPLRGLLTFSGSASATDAGRTVQIERRGESTDWTWTPTSTTTVSVTGAFDATWHTSQSGRFAVRAVVVSDLATVASAAPTLTVTVYPTSKATIYGPGFYGRQTACGAILTRATIGVANRHLACGTKVSILYDGRTLVVPVVDRGPYANGADWDLTIATAQALGIQGTERIGTIALGSPTVSADGLGR